MLPETCLAYFRMSGAILFYADFDFPLQDFRLQQNLSTPFRGFEIGACLAES
jgi:hypothetical protein